MAKNIFGMPEGTIAILVVYANSFFENHFFDTPGRTFYAE